MSRKSHLAIARSHADEALSRSASDVGVGAVSDVVGFGTYTLALGTATVPFPKITANSQVLAMLALANASTALGTQSVVITPGVGFVATSLQDGTPGATQTGDLGTYRYIVVNPR